MREVLSILVVVGGGLGTFLMGMKHLSEGLQSVSGSGLRRFMSLATTHRLAGIGTGVVSTIIVQSSSIITVMTVGFVTSGFMTLPQAINVIIGSNIGTTAMFVPFVKPFAGLVSRIIRAPESEKPHLSALDMTSHLSPVIACDQALMEVTFMRDSDIELLGCVRKVLSGEADERTEDHIAHREEVLDNVQREVTEFLGKVMSRRLSGTVAARARRLLRMTDELESVSDEAATILKVTRRLRKGGQNFSAQSLGVLLGVHDGIASFAAKVSGYLKSPRPKFDLLAVQAESAGLRDIVRDSRRRQLDRVGPDDPSSPVRVLVELDILNAYERIRGYYLNIAETLAGGKG